jgi:hypothetical protein
MKRILFSLCAAALLSGLTLSAGARPVNRPVSPLLPSPPEAAQETPAVS